MKSWKKLLNNLPVGVLIYEKTALQFANLSAQKLMVGDVCEEQPPARLSEAVEKNDELKSAFGFQAADQNRILVSNLTSTAEMLSTGTDTVGNNSETHLCVLNERPLCISTVMLGLNHANVRDKVCIVQDQSVYNELQKEKLAKQYMKNFFAMITHELRNPLQGVLGLFESMLDELKEEGPKQSCRMGVSTVKLMMGLINDILDLSQLESKSFRLVEDEVNVRELIAECVELMGFKYKMKGVGLVHKESANLPRTFRCDRNRYMQILLNILGNALKFTERGEVVVTVRYDAPSEKLYTAVKDSGIGIKEEDKGKLFMFFGKLGDSAHMNPQGCGLGLHICKKLSEAMGGEVKLESEYMKGTTITYSILNKRTTPAEASGPKGPIPVPAAVSASSDKQDISFSIPNEGLELNSSYFGFGRNTDAALHQNNDSPETRPQQEEPRVLVVDDEGMCSTVVRAHLRHCGVAVDIVCLAAIIPIGNIRPAGDRVRERPDEVRRLPADIHGREHAGDGRDRGNAGDKADVQGDGAAVHRGHDRRRGSGHRGAVQDFWHGLHKYVGG